MNIINYLFIGFVFTFLIDYVCDKFEVFQKVPDWDWGARMIFILFWPIGLLIFLYYFLKASRK